MTVPYRPMAARRPDEAHRASTPLELLFDLSSVVAVASAAAMLHHSLSENHIGHGVVGYLTVFFAIWWAWLNFTWFASSYDTDDVVHRVTTLVQITGVLVLAVGVPSAFEDGGFTVVTIGYVLMRLAMVSQWLRARHGDPERRTTATRYAVGVTVVQLGWVGRLFLPEGLLLAAFRGARRVRDAGAGDRRTGGGHHLPRRPRGRAVRPVHPHRARRVDPRGEQRDPRGPGLGTDVASLASLSFAGLEVSVDYASHVAHLPPVAAAMTTTVPVAVYLLVVWFLQVFPSTRGTAMWAFPAGAVLVLAASFGPAPIHVTAVLLAALVAVVVTSERGRRSGA
jgi:hypothetical protein